nr:MAG TPA: hypothetical protein [Caudoviricetes sp.]
MQRGKREGAQDRNPLPPLHLSTTAQAGKAQHARFTVQ